VKLIQAVAAMALLFNFPCVSKVQSGSLNHKATFADNWPVTNGVDAQHQTTHCAYVSDPVDKGQDVLNRIRSNFNPTLLSSANATATFDFHVLSTGEISWNLVSSSAASDADIFYCEQCLFESSPMEKIYFNGKGSIEFRGSSKSQSKVHAKFVTMHFVPESVVPLYYQQGYFMEPDITCKQNSISLPVSKIKSERLKEFRTEWNRFLVSNGRKTTKTEVVSFAKTLRKNYADLLGPDL
jgi:hypothetical protein